VKRACHARASRIAMRLPASSTAMQETVSAMAQRVRLHLELGVAEQPLRVGERSLVLCRVDDRDEGAQECGERRAARSPQEPDERHEPRSART
jgi:hypothetical protein